MPQAALCPRARATEALGPLDRPIGQDPLDRPFGQSAGPFGHSSFGQSAACSNSCRNCPAQPHHHAPIKARRDDFRRCWDICADHLARPPTDNKAGRSGKRKRRRLSFRSCGQDAVCLLLSLLLAAAAKYHGRCSVRCWGRKQRRASTGPGAPPPLVAQLHNAPGLIFRSRPPGFQVWSMDTCSMRVPDAAVGTGPPTACTHQSCAPHAICTSVCSMCHMHVRVLHAPYACLCAPCAFHSASSN